MFRGGEMSAKLMGIYYIQNNANGKRYIGSSVDIRRRLAGHLNLLRKGKHVNVHLSRAWDNHGEETFETGVCELVESSDDLVAREQFWIDAEGYYNLAPAAGSTLGFKHSDEFKANASARVSGDKNPMYGTKRPDVGERMRAIHTGRVLTDEHKRKCSDALKGKDAGIPLSEDRKAKIGAANRGRVLTPEHRAKIAEAGRNRLPVSDETREKLRVAGTDRHHTDATKAVLSKLKLGVPRSAESVLKQKETIRLRKAAKRSL